MNLQEIIVVSISSGLVLSLAQIWSKFRDKQELSREMREDDGLLFRKEIIVEMRKEVARLQAELATNDTIIETLRKEKTDLMIENARLKFELDRGMLKL